MTTSHWTALTMSMLVGCASGSGGQPAESPAPEESSPTEVAPADVPAEEEGSDSESAPTEAVEPAFTPGMSVLEATNAVPSSAERLNIEQERLAEPLMKPELYEPCGLAQHKRFQLKVAVWDGRAVGLDVTTKPKDEKLEACLRQQIGTIEWPDKAKSLNTVEYSF